MREIEDVSLAREIVTEFAPEEVEIFDDLIDVDPKLIGTAEAALSFGVDPDLQSYAVIVLMAISHVSLLLTTRIGDRLAQSAANEIADGSVKRFRAWLVALRKSPSAEKEQVALVGEVRANIISLARENNFSVEKSEAIADALIKALVSRASSQET